MFRVSVLALCLCSLTCNADESLEKAISTIKEHMAMALAQPTPGYQLKVEHVAEPSGEVFTRPTIRAYSAIIFPQFELNKRPHSGPILKLLKWKAAGEREFEQVVFEFNFATARELKLDSHALTFDAKENPEEFRTLKGLFVETLRSISKNWNCDDILDGDKK